MEPPLKRRKTMAVFLPYDVMQNIMSFYVGHGQELARCDLKKRQENFKANGALAELLKETGVHFDMAEQQTWNHRVHVHNNNGNFLHMAWAPLYHWKHRHPHHRQPIILKAPRGLNIIKSSPKLGFGFTSCHRCMTHQTKEENECYCPIQADYMIVLLELRGDKMGREELMKHYGDRELKPESSKGTTPLKQRLWMLRRCRYRRIKKALQSGKVSRTELHTRMLASTKQSGYQEQYSQHGCWDAVRKEREREAKEAYKFRDFLTKMDLERDNLAPMSRAENHGTWFGENENETEFMAAWNQNY